MTLKRETNLLFDLSQKLRTFISVLLRLIIVSVFAALSGCSFHSTQWEGAKRLWAAKFSEAEQGKTSYWWRLEHADEFYTLFPVDWQGDSILTDGRRWIFVIRGGNVEVVRDLQLGTELQIRYRNENYGHLIPDRGEFDIIGAHANWNLQDELVSSVAVEQKDIGSAQLQRFEVLKCRPLVFEVEHERWVRWCAIGAQLSEFSELEFDKDANVKSLKLSIEWLGRLKIIRTDERVTEKALEQYLIRGAHGSSQATIL